jgi:hypothetical protein
MNNKIKTTLLGGLLSASIASPLLAGDFASPIQVVAPEAADMFSFSAGYHSTYVFRGANFGDDLTDWSLEASKTVGSYDLTAGVWQGNVNTAATETDFYLGASKDLGFATLDMGYIFYYFDGATAGNTQEVYLGLTKEMVGVEFSATYYYDFDLNDTSYLELGASKTLTLAGQELDASLTLGFDIEETELSHVQANVSKSYDLNSAVSVTPYVQYSFAIEDNDYAGNLIDDEFVAGVSLGFSF